jgi:aspartate kinase
MQVFKFGGASVKDAAGVVNLAQIVSKYKGEELLIVVSAMGKTTNALEKLTSAYFQHSPDVQDIFEEVKAYHEQIVSQLFPANDPVYNEVANTFVEIDWMIEEEPHDDYDFIYDQIVSIGEMVSTRIVSAYLNREGIGNKWLDVRGYIHTDNTYREGQVDWNKTRAAIQRDLPAMLQKGMLVTQGFLGGTSENFTTTLGREGSDYTASIFAACLGAKSVTAWKDVPGIMNSDPKLFDDTIKFDELSYAEAIEMTFYGASVIHPKTIKPLQNANIPLLVKPFNDPEASGTLISETSVPHFQKPVIIIKQNQVLISISAKDYSFISENHLSDIFTILSANQVKVNVMQTSALSFTIGVDFEEDHFSKAIAALKENFRVKYNTGLTLITVRHYQQEALKDLTAGRIVLLEQISRNTAQMVTR